MRLPLRAGHILIWPLLVVIAGGCGFHLRTYQLDTSVDSVHLSSSGNNLAEEPLERSLRQAGVTLVPTAEEAELIVELLQDRKDRRSVSVTETTRAAEYETTIGIRYAVQRADGTVLIAPRWIEATRIYRVDRINIVGSSEEQVLLEREMVNDLVQQILRSLDAASQDQPGAA